MNVSEYMKKHGLTDAALDDMGLPYEQGEYKSEVGTIYNGSHVDAVGKWRVADIARKR